MILDLICRLLRWCLGGLYWRLLEWLFPIKSPDIVDIPLWLIADISDKDYPELAEVDNIAKKYPHYDPYEVNSGK